MSTMGTFDGFTTARLGIYAAQLGLTVTGNNVSNINTEGYTRQRIDQLSFKAGAYDRYRSQLDNHVGSGALVMSINQIRDPYLDVRFRNTAADVGYYDRMLTGLKGIQKILDEVGLGEDASSNEEGDGIIHAQLQKLADELRKFEKEPTDLNDTLVRNAAETLCSLLNKYSERLDALYKETEKDFNDKMSEINECLTNIRDLNREIRDNEIYGDNALELRDERNRQIDTLSQLIHIKVVYTEEEVGCGQMVEKLSIYLDNDNPDPNVHTDETMLIDGIYGAQLYAPESMPLINPNFAKAGDPTEGYLYLILDPNADPADPLAGATGTNDPTKATYVRENDYFGVQVTKLYDHKGREWKGITTEYNRVPQADLATWAPDPNKPAEEATYTYSVKASSAETWDGVTSIQIGDDTLKIPDDVTVDQLTDPAQLAQLIADHVTSADYDIAVNGDQLIYTAKNPGRVGQSGPASAPKLTFVAGTGPAASAKITATLESSYRGAEQGLLPPQETTTTLKDGTVNTKGYTQLDGMWYEVLTSTKPTVETALDDNDLHGSFQAVRELLTEAGEFATTDMRDNIDENAVGKRGIRYYQYSLDLLAKQFADQYNKLNRGYMLNEKGNYIDKNGSELMLPEEDGTLLPIGSTTGMTDSQKANLVNNYYVKDDKGDPVLDREGNKIPDLDAWLLDNGAVPMGGYLFSNRNDNDDSTGINAGNISIAQSWSNGKVQLVPKYEVLFGGDLEHSSQNTNAAHMINLIERDLFYDPRDIIPDAAGTKLFEGNFNGMFDNINVTLGKDIREQNIYFNTSYGTWVEIDTSREGVSGVDLNDEAMNMMQYQKALNAAMRMMTVIDEALDRLINNTGVAGR